MIHPARLAVAIVLVALLPVAAARAGPVLQVVQPGIVQVSQDSFAAHSEPMLAENPANPLDLVGGSKFFSSVKRYRFKIGTFVSLDGGATWTDNGLLPGFGSYATTSDVSFAFSPDGAIVYACVLAVGRKTSGVFVSRSFDGGRRWTVPIAVFRTSSPALFNDKPWITVDATHSPHRGSVYVAWNLDSLVGADAGDPDAGNGAQTRPTTTAKPKRPVGIAVARSTDSGGSFAAPVIVSRFTGNEFALGAVPAVGKLGRLYVIFTRFHGPDRARRYDLGMAMSVNGGKTFAATRAIVPSVKALPGHLPHGTFRNFTLPTFAISPVTGTLMTVFADMRHGDADILKSTSRDMGRSWSVPARVNDDSVGDHADQFQPQLAVAPDGTFACLWFDRRFDSGDRLIDTVVAISTNDGKTFRRNVRVTPRSWDPSIDAPRPEHKPGNTFIGDYQGLAVDNVTAHPFWNDTANGRSQEIRTEAVSLSELTLP